VARLTYLFRPKTSLAAVLDTTASPYLTPDGYEWTIFGADDPSNVMLAAKRYAALSVLPPLRDAEGDLDRSDRSPLTRLLRELPPSDANLNDALSAAVWCGSHLACNPPVTVAGERLKRGLPSSK